MTYNLNENDWAFIGELSESKDIVAFLNEVHDEDIQLHLLYYFPL